MLLSFSGRVLSGATGLRPEAAQRPVQIASAARVPGRVHVVCQRPGEGAQGACPSVPGQKHQLAQGVPETARSSQR